jgi:IS6 family transposase
VITVAVRWYLRYGLSNRDVEELLAERAVEVDHELGERGRGDRI